MGPSRERVDLLREDFAHAVRAVRWQVEGLGDDEYAWEPVDDAWTVRPRAGARGHHVGHGRWVIDDHGVDPPGVPTIAWRLLHLAGCLDIYRATTFRGSQRSWDDLLFPATASESVAWLHGLQDAWLDDLARLTDGDLDRAVRTFWGERIATGRVVRQLTVEQLHHGAEIGLLRDLQRGHTRTDPWPEP